jgi:hypothetical protein
MKNGDAVFTDVFPIYIKNNELQSIYTEFTIAFSYFSKETP